MCKKNSHKKVKLKNLKVNVNISKKIQKWLTLFECLPLIFRMVSVRIQVVLLDNHVFSVLRLVVIRQQLVSKIWPEIV